MNCYQQYITKHIFIELFMLGALHPDGMGFDFMGTPITSHYSQACFMWPGAAMWNKDRFAACSDSSLRLNCLALLFEEFGFISHICSSILITYYEFCLSLFPFCNDSS